MENQKIDNELNSQDFRQPENQSPPDFYDYNFDDLPTERPQTVQAEPEPVNNIEYDNVERELAESVEISQPETTEPVQDNATSDNSSEPVNSIEYDGVTRELGEPEPSNRQPEIRPAMPTNENEQEIPKQPQLEPRKAITDLSYTPPQELDARYIIADTAKIRLLNQDIGAHSVKYLSPDNAQTVLIEDKGKSIHTTRSDQQTIQDMLAVAQAKNWDSIKISGSQEFRQQMWLEAESRGIATKGYKPSPEDLALLEHRRAQRSTNQIAEAENLKQQSAIPEKNGTQSIPTEAVKTADQAKEKFHQKVGMLDYAQQVKAQAFEKIGLAILERLPNETREKFAQNFYENQAEKINDGKYHAPDPIREVREHEQPSKQSKEQDHAQEKSQSRDDWEMER